MGDNGGYAELVALTERIRLLALELRDDRLQEAQEQPPKGARDHGRSRGNAAEM